MGIRSPVSKSTSVDANEKSDWRIYADFAQVLINTARDLYVDHDFGVELDETVYALDASTIDLCLSLFPWTRFRKTKGAIKLHTLLDLRGSIPTFISITDGKVHDVNVLDYLFLEPGAFYVMDRGYLDFARLFEITKASAFFIIRSKRNTQLRRIYSSPVDKSTGLRCDQTVVFTGYNASRDYPEKLRRIKFYDEEKKRSFTFLTNNFVLPAIVITQLYKSRWQIELFFKWIKQHLRIKAFYGTSMNAVKTQIWIAISIYVLVAIMKKELKLEASLYTILQILSVTIFEKCPILGVLADEELQNQMHIHHNQVNLFDL